ncbi:hypothetical protein V8F06_009984 [Rhypophila decipiens]
MHFRNIIHGLLTIALASDVYARLVVDFPPVTKLEPSAVQKRAASTSSLPLPPQISEDPGQCVKENITHYFLDVPRPTGNVQSGINSYNDRLNQGCFATATGADILGCTISNPKQWCSFTTAALPSILSSYSTYASAVTSFWKENSESISKLSTSCPVSWAKPDALKRAYLDLAIAHAECFLQGNPTASRTSPPTGTVANPTTVPTTKATTTTSKGVNLRAIETIVLMSTGIAVLAGTA